MKKEIFSLGIAFLGFACNPQMEILNFPEAQMADENPLYDPNFGDYENPFTKKTPPEIKPNKTPENSNSFTFTSSQEKATFIESYFSIYQDACNDLYGLIRYETPIDLSSCFTKIDQFIESGILTESFRNTFQKEMNYWAEQIAKTPINKRHNLIVVAPNYLFEIFISPISKVFNTPSSWIKENNNNKFSHSFDFSLGVDDEVHNLPQTIYFHEIQSYISGQIVSIHFVYSGNKIRIKVIEN